MKRGYIFTLILLILIIFSLSNSSGFISSLAILGNCKDSTLNNKCSTEKPFFCQNSELIRNCSLCGCSPCYLCDSSTNLCELADYCEQAQGTCEASCDSPLIELTLLTESCNAGEMINNNINPAGKSLKLQVELENTNEFAPLTDISTIAYIEGLTEAGDGFFLDTIEPLNKFEKDLLLNLPENFDKTKNYKLIFIIAYQDKQQTKEYNINFQGDYFVYTIKDVTFLSDNTNYIELTEDLKYSVKIINRKCCLKPSIKTNSESFLGYCDNKVPYNKCSTEKPLYCNNGLLVEECSKCGCPNNFICNKDKKCEYIVIDQEIQKFYNTIKADSNDKPILKFLGYKLARVAKSPITPEYIIVDKELNQIKVKTNDVDLKISKTDTTPKIEAEING